MHSKMKTVQPVNLKSPKLKPCDIFEMLRDCAEKLQQALCVSGTCIK